jgi:hypothetical protein
LFLILLKIKKYNNKKITNNSLLLFYISTKKVQI